MSVHSVLDLWHRHLVQTEKRAVLYNRDLLRFVVRADQVIIFIVQLYSPYGPGQHQFIFGQFVPRMDFYRLPVDQICGPLLSLADPPLLPDCIVSVWQKTQSVEFFALRFH